MNKQANQMHVDSMRGLACFLVVLNHVVGSSGTGLNLSSSSWFHYFNEVLVYIRLPLFTFISGYVYSFRPVERGGEAGYLFKRVMRLYTPLILVAIPFEFIQAMMEQSHNISFYELLSPLFVARNHFWYLQALIIISIVVVVFEMLAAKKRNLYLCMFFICSFFLYLIVPAEIVCFSFSGFAYIFPFFLLGMLIQIPIIKKTMGNGVTNYLLMIAVCTFFIFREIFARFYLAIPIGFGSVFMLVYGSICCVLVFNAQLNVKFLAIIGYYSFPIYLLHVYFTNLSKLLSSHINNSTLAVCMGLIAGVIGPCLMTKLINNKPFISMFFLGVPLFMKSKNNAG